MALILSGDTGVPASGMPTGSVIQTASTTTTTYTNVASTSLTDVSGLTVTITPTSATSKILVFAAVNYNIRRSTNDIITGNIVIVRNGSVIYTGERAAMMKAGTSVGGDVINGSEASLVTLDSPATTSAVTYKIQGCVNTTSNSGSINFNDYSSGTSSSSITVMEIKQ